MGSLKSARRSRSPQLFTTQRARTISPSTCSLWFMVVGRPSFSFRCAAADAAAADSVQGPGWLGSEGCWVPRSAACGMRGLGSTSCRETTKVPVRTRWDAVHTIQSLSHIEIGRANGDTSTGTQTDRLSVRDGTDTVLHPTPHELDRARDVEAPISDACVAVRRGLKMSSLPSVFVWAVGVDSQKAQARADDTAADRWARPPGQFSTLAKWLTASDAAAGLWGTAAVARPWID